MLQHLNVESFSCPIGTHGFVPGVAEYRFTIIRKLPSLLARLRMAVVIYISTNLSIFL